jgi:CHAT domain-containing protein
LELPLLGSAGLLLYLIVNMMQPGGPEFVGFGDPDFARSNESRTSCPPLSEGERAETPALDTLFQGVNTNLKGVRALKRLPGTCREVKGLAQAFNASPGNVVLGLAASEPGVRNHPRISEARIIAFATHGLVAGNLENTLTQPALALTPPPETPDQQPPIEDDGLLTTTDAATLDLQADWVLLSACDTAAKDGNDPDGLSGLARAFFYAGARSLLVSHWKVDDEAAMRLTTKAVELQAKDPSLTRPEAFRLSMQALIEDTNNPRFVNPGLWAPFFIVSPE